MTKTCTIVGALALLTTAGLSNAQTVNIVFSPLHESGFNGGEFETRLSNGKVYRSFCLELNENVTPNMNQNYLYTIDTSGAMAGGQNLPGNPGGNPDPVSPAAASIFVKWLSGALPQDSTYSTAVQNAIWALEGEVTVGSLSGIASTLYNDAIAAYPDLSLNATQLSEFANIRVVNPFRVRDNGSIQRFQSQLILIPLPTASGMALAGLALVGTRRRR